MNRKGTESLRRFVQLLLACSVVALVVVATSGCASVSLTEELFREIKVTSKPTQCEVLGGNDTVQYGAPRRINPKPEYCI